MHAALFIVAGVYASLRAAPEHHAHRTAALLSREDPPESKTHEEAIDAMGKKSLKDVESGEDYDKNYVSNETATAKEVTPISDEKDDAKKTKDMGSKKLAHLPGGPGYDYDADFVRDGKNHGQTPPRPKTSSAAVVGIFVALGLF